MQTLMLPFLAQVSASPDWHAVSLGQGLFYMVIFAVVGIALAILGYKLFDLATPGKLHEEIIQNKNIAAALVGGSVIIGVCIIVAAAIVG